MANNIKPTEAWGFFDKDGNPEAIAAAVDAERGDWVGAYCVDDVEDAECAAELLVYRGGSVQRVYIVPAEEWERLRDGQ